MKEANLDPKQMDQKAFFGIGLLALLVLLVVGFVAFFNSLSADVRPIAVREDCRNRLTSLYRELFIELKSSALGTPTADARLDEYLESQASESRWLCPGASGRDKNFCFNPNIRIKSLLDGRYADDVVIACDSDVDNHCVEQNCWVNFLRADGSVCSRQVNESDFQEWISKFRRGDVDRHAATP